MHYFRWRRHGDPLTIVSQLGARDRKNDRGYVKIRLTPTHPLAGGSYRWEYEHRIVVFDVYGPGPYRCYWCHVRPLEWSDMHADHIDHDRSNNDPVNIRPSCLSCNVGRHEGADTEGWARGTAMRRVINAHADEFTAEVEALMVELEPADRGNRTQRKNRRAQETYVVRSLP